MNRMTSPRRPGGGIFASLRFHNYRLWFLSALVANTGTWMQRVAQDWLVLRVLTDDSASATGLTTALQFLPMLLLSAHAGLVADRVDQRKFLILTQSAMGLVSAVLALDVLAGTARLWHVYLAAFLTGVAAAYDAPARQTFVARMVPAEHLSNAVGLNSASFNAARLLGPALAGVVITWVGAGWVFAVNAATFVFPAVALVAMRVSSSRSTRSGVCAASFKHSIAMCLYSSDDGMIDPISLANYETRTCAHKTISVTGGEADVLFALYMPRLTQSRYEAGVALLEPQAP